MALLTSMLIVTVDSLRAVGDLEVERVRADVGRERRPPEHACAARRHRDLRVTREVGEVGGVVVVRQPVAVDVGAIEVDRQLGADLRDLIRQTHELGRVTAAAGYLSSQQRQRSQGR